MREKNCSELVRNIVGWQLDSNGKALSSRRATNIFLDKKKKNTEQGNPGAQNTFKSIRHKLKINLSFIT